MKDGQDGYCASCEDWTVIHRQWLGKNVKPNYIYACGRCDSIVVFENKDKHDEYMENHEPVEQ